MKAIHHPGLFDAWKNDTLRESEHQGHYEFCDVQVRGADGERTERRMAWVCPGACKSFNLLPIRPVGGDVQSWAFDGNEAAPTLHPSINHVGCWHGWLKAGEFTSC